MPADAPARPRDLARCQTEGLGGLLDRVAVGGERRHHAVARRDAAHRYAVLRVRNPAVGGPAGLVRLVPRHVDSPLSALPALARHAGMVAVGVQHRVVRHSEQPRRKRGFARVESRQTLTDVEPDERREVVAVEERVGDAPPRHNPAQTPQLLVTDGGWLRAQWLTSLRAVSRRCGRTSTPPS